MKKTNQFSKAKMLGLIAGIALSLPSYAQVYLQDYTSLHLDPDRKQWVAQDAIYRDDHNERGEVYYLAQQLRPVDTKESFLGITMCDKDMKVITTWEYINESKEMTISTETIDEMEETRSLILTGHYSNRRDLSYPFVMSVDKYSGAVNWFKLFPTLGELTSVVAEKDFALVTGTRPFRQGEGIYPYSASAAVIFRLDASGNLVWEREWESDKYRNSDYEPKQIYSILNDVKRYDDKYFIAVGATNQFVFRENPRNLWDSDGLMVMIDADGNPRFSLSLGNVLPMSSNGQQAIQYELFDHLTVSPEDKTVVIAGERLDNPQNVVSDKSPTPKEWGLWVTKIDPNNVSTAWSYRYQYGEKYYRVNDPEIEDDGAKQSGLSYNFSRYPMAMKLKDNGNVLYHRYHFMSGQDNSAVRFNDITRAFEYNNMTLEGHYNPDLNVYNSSYGWNVQAFDNILEKCQMEDFDVKPKEVAYEIERMQIREYRLEIKDERLNEQDVKLDNKVVCDKRQVSKKLADANEINSEVSQDAVSNTISVQLTGDLAIGAANSKAVLYNALGQKMLESSNFNIQYKMDVNGLPTGIYYLQVLNGQYKKAHTVFIR